MMKNLILLSSIGVIAATQAAAIQVVDYQYGLNPGGAAGPARSSNIDTSTQVIYNFDDANYLFNPSAATTGTGATSTAFYGAYNGEVNTGELNPGINMFKNNGTLALTANQGDGGVTSYSATAESLVLWDKDDFLGGSAQTLAFDTSSDTKVSINFLRLDGSARLVVRDGATYYMSEVVKNGKNTYTYDGSADGPLEWALYDPTASSGAGFNIVPSSGYSEMTFSDVTAIGFYTDVANTDAPARMTIADGGLTFDLAIVPEPSAYALFIGLISLVYVARRRR